MTTSRQTVTIDRPANAPAGTTMRLVNHATGEVLVYGRGPSLQDRDVKGWVMRWRTARRPDKVRVEFWGK